MSDCWSTLGISPTSERKPIKRAYTKLIKQYGPETHPEKFQEIRAAYENALHFSQYISDCEDDNEEECSSARKENQSLDQTTISTYRLEESPETEPAVATDIPNHHDKNTLMNEPKEGSYSEEPDGEGIQTDEEELPNYAIEYMRKVETALKDKKTSSTQETWENLTKEASELDIESKQDIWFQLFYFLADQFEPKLMYSHPQIVIRTIREFNNIFHWSEHELELQQHFDTESINKIIYAVDATKLINTSTKNTPSSEEAQGKSKIGTILFFMFIIFALARCFNALEEKNTDRNPSYNNTQEVSTTQKNLEKANNLFLEAKYMADKEEWKVAIRFYTQVIELVPTAPQSYLGRGIAYNYLDKHEEALKDFGEVVSLSRGSSTTYERSQDVLGTPDIQHATVFAYRAMSVIQFEMERYEDALMNIWEAISLDPENPTLYKIQSQIYIQQKEYKNAINSITEELGLNEELESYKTRAWLYFQLNDSESACKDLKIACEMRDTPSCELQKEYCFS